MRRFAILFLALAVMAAACSRGDDADLTTTTTTAGSPTTTSTAGTTSGGGTDDETTTTVGATEVPPYTIIAGDPGSDEYVVLVEPGTYSQRDIRNIMEGFVDEYAPVTAHLVDSEDVRDLVRKGELTDLEQELVDDHYFARIVDGTTLDYLGPYAGLDSVHIGS